MTPAFKKSPAGERSVLRTPSILLVEEAPTKSNDWGTEPNATWYDLKQLAFAVLLFELVVAALAYATRVFFGVRTALWVGFGIGTIVLVAFVLIALFGVFTHTIAAFFARREMRRRQNR